MIRKMLLIASAVAMPLAATAVTAIAGPTIAGAVSVPIVCHPIAPLGTLTYGAPGLTLGGTLSANPTSTNTTTAQTLHCTGGVSGNGTSPGGSSVTNSTACTGVNLPVPGCALGLFNQGKIADAPNVSTLWTHVPTVSWTIGATTYKMTTNSSNLAAGCLSLGEVGFTIHGIMSAPASVSGHAAKSVICFGADTGPGTSGSTLADFANSTFGGTIATSVLSANSKIRVA